MPKTVRICGEANTWSYFLDGETWEVSKTPFTLFSYFRDPFAACVLAFANAADLTICRDPFLGGFLKLLVWVSLELKSFKPPKMTIISGFEHNFAVKKPMEHGLTPKNRRIWSGSFTDFTTIVGSDQSERTKSAQATSLVLGNIPL